ncbi:SDR family oxidoreductase [Gordonia soli]|uniref:Putative oxidoreductase n=1 Tax=Gordonia soli NBRC 108243 TaxID=1223545 RepID=M0QGT4_9ACTN|nr:SDR family oxidoreductase [Gordonia soli]GAC67835.1 putative oxidoreductase [Gordonia soli NBRC 108243]
MTGSVLTVIGVGGMGEAVARRLGHGRVLLLADVDAESLDRVADPLARSGYHVHRHVVDVSDGAAVAELAARAVSLGSVDALVHTAGVSPAQAPAERIVAVDLIGTAHVVGEFGRVIASGGAGVVIASVAGHIFADAVDAQATEHFAHASAASLPDLELFDVAALPADLGRAVTYGYCKRANQIRVQYAAPGWGDRGARLNSVSPGVIATEMGWTEFSADFAHSSYEAMVTRCAAARFGTAEDVAAAVEFLLDPVRASFVTGTDLLVDGGVVAGVRSGRIPLT